MKQNKKYVVVALDHLFNYNQQDKYKNNNKNTYDYFQ